jgi:hypothetical protein
MLWYITIWTSMRFQGLPCSATTGASPVAATTPASPPPSALHLHRLASCSPDIGLMMQIEDQVHAMRPPASTQLIMHPALCLCLDCFYTCTFTPGFDPFDCFGPGQCPAFHQALRLFIAGACELSKYSDILYALFGMILTSDLHMQLYTSRYLNILLYSVIYIPVQGHISHNNQ